MQQPLSKEVCLMKRTENQEPDYGNWVPAAMMKILVALTVVLLTAELLFLFFLENVILSVIGGIFPHSHGPLHHLYVAMPGYL